MNDLMRINKAIARAGVCSRRKADELIRQGKVTVNDMVISEMGVMVDTVKDKITVNGQQINHAPQHNSFTYVMLNKPVQVVTTMADPENRKTVFDLLPDDFNKKRLFPVGRLDYFSEGLLLMTNDGELTHRLTHPSWKQPKTYHVLVREKPSSSMLNILKMGMTLKDGQKLAPIRARIIDTRNNGFTLEMILTQGVNRQIRKICQDFGLTILRLVRISQGPLHIGELQPGKTRSLTPKEILGLKESVGL
ncbi:pseudouridine synthase [Desulfonatronovibrio magnus]|uniref:pseudouridine synthase n=1 Tax=Desulfonatronovibrio magnus TaxID=698827 RepID=UPI0005EBD0FF|nr:pseudouridine synthase [Desulfonatronovibrio magnus]